MKEVLIFLAALGVGLVLGLNVGEKHLATATKAAVDDERTRCDADWYNIFMQLTVPARKPNADHNRKNPSAG